MQSKPAGWPHDPLIETLPRMFLLTEGQWPPAADGFPAGTAQVGQWSITRSLTGSPLPGQVRGAVGFSIGTGSVTFPQPWDAPVVPWAKTSGHRLTVGGKCQLVASHSAPGAGLSLGKFVVAPSSGNSISNEVQVDLEEDYIRLRKPLKLDWQFNQDHDFYLARVRAGAEAYELDAAWILDQIARSGGYYQTPRPAASTLLSVPLVGGTMADRGTTTGAGIIGWTESDGLVGLLGGSYVTVVSDETIPTSFRLACQVSGTGGRIFLGSKVIIDVRSTRVDLRSANTIYGTMAYSAGPGVARVVLAVSVAAPRTVRIDVMVDGVSAGSLTGAFSAGDWAAWESEITVDTRSSQGGGSTANRFIRGVRVYTNAALDGFGWVPSAQINLTGSAMHGVFHAEDTDAWSAAQSIATATMGAVWISEDGIFTYRSRDRLRGLTGTLGELEATERLEDLPWQIDPSDIADRVEFTYTPSTAEYSTAGAITLWEATNSIKINAGKSVDVIAEIEGTTSRIADFIPIWDETVAEGRLSRWAASNSPDSGGERVNTISVAVSFLSPSRIRLRVTNSGTETAWLVDGNGNPTLILRAYLHIAPDEPVTISTGVSAEESTSRLSVDAGAWVQDADAAQAMLSWVTGQTSHAQPTVAQVRVKPDLGYQLGDVLLLTDRITGLRTKVLISGVSLAGDATGYTQRLDLAVLDLTWEDFDRWLRRNNINDFTALDAFMQSNNLNTFTGFDQWGQDFGGTL